jgi:putative transposase
MPSREYPGGKLINSNYAKYFNRRYSRHGYLFQDRFKSIVTQDQKYLEELIRYVHLNPLRAGICENIDALDVYPWCGHSVIMGNCSNSFQEVNTVLRYFAVRIQTARKRYRQFIEGGTDSVDRDWLSETVRASKSGVERKDRPGCMVIGDRDFVISVMEKNREQLRTQHILRRRWMIDDVFTTVAQQNGLAPDELKNRSRSTTISLCRKIAAYICCRVVGHTVTEVALYLNVSGPAVSSMIKKGEVLVDKRSVFKFTKLPPG